MAYNASYAGSINDVPVAICPFDKSHMVTRKRLQYHIAKCRKNYTGDKVPCPYNASEFIDKRDMAQHLSTCHSKQFVEEQMLRHSSSVKGQPSRSAETVSFKMNQLDDENEFWN